MASQSHPRLTKTTRAGLPATSNEAAEPRLGSLIETPETRKAPAESRRTRFKTSWECAGRACRLFQEKICR
ncbi:hypothetical protein HPB48_017470 [Haemaphysalis longicornis]|uniref:Uncharacterized protein n=1 Tax=Haemaphysalis longicornis TaxID=44386 RepID=A0A9J6FQW4_HAELO|nr:hypothetical protein HPB48_017470 [Haemaphysalis longicornis]